MTDSKPSDDEVKDFVLRSIYYDQETGFQNQKRTYELAKKRLSDITPKYVSQWFDKQKFQQFKPYKEFNLTFILKAVILATAHQVQVCDYEPCKFGKCIELPETKSYKCECFLNWTGKDCDECKLK